MSTASLQQALDTAPSLNQETEREIPEDEEYDPQWPEIVNGKEWMIQRITHEGKIDNFAGAWPRAMIENSIKNPTQDLWVGISENSGREFGIKFSQAFRHILLLGATGGGKTQQLYGLLTMLMYGEHGMAVVDPKADDLFEHLLRRVPPWLEDKLAYMDVSARHFKLEHPETGEQVPYMTGFNVLNTDLEYGDPGYNEEVAWIGSNFADLLDIPKSWTKARRDIRDMVLGMVRHEDEFTPIEVFYALSTEENRREHANLLSQSLTDENIRFIQSHMERAIEQASESDLDPLLGKLSDWVLDPIARNAIATRGANLTLGKVVRDSMFLFVNTKLPKPIDKMVAKMIKTGIWSAVNSRLSEAERKIQEYSGVENPGTSYKPFFLAIDECHRVFETEDEIETMMFEGRSKKLGMILSTQRLRSIPDNAADSMLSEANTAIILTTNHPSEQKELADRLGDIDPSELAKIPEHHAKTKLNSDDDPFLARLIPPYPPLRTIKETTELIHKALGNWGTPIPTAKEQLEEMHYESGVTFPNEDGEVVDPLGGDRDAERVIVKRLYDETIKHDDVVEPTPISDKQACDAICNEFDVSMTQAAQMLEVFEEKTYIRSRLSDGANLYTVTQSVPEDDLESGIELIGLKSGSGGSGGGPVHRAVLQRLYVEFVRLGYNPEIPTQGGKDDMADMICHLPPELDSMSLSKALSTLKEKYGVLYRLSGDSKLIVEVENSGISKPGGPVKNFADIMGEEDGEALFAVADGGSKGLTDNARRLTNIFVDPPMSSPKVPKDAARRFYTKHDITAKHIDPDDATAGTEYAIHPDPHASLRWVERPDGSVVCRTSDGEVVVEYESIEAFTQRSASDFPGVAYKDTDNDVYVAEWVDESGVRQKKKRATRPKLKKEVTFIKMPTIPELLFGEVPDPEWTAEKITMVIVPDEPEDEDAPMPELLKYDILTGETTTFSEYLGIEYGERSRRVAGSVEDGSDEESSVDGPSAEEPAQMSLEERVAQLDSDDD